MDYLEFEYEGEIYLQDGDMTVLDPVDFDDLTEGNAIFRAEEYSDAYTLEA